MKLLVCDIEGTIFAPHMIKSAQHASYIWTALAEALGREAEREEINSQRKWRNGDYGAFDTGAAYIRWVNDSIAIHRRYGLKEQVFSDIIAQAPYIAGVPEFFRRLDRSKYLPVFISGGIQNLNERACAELGVSPGDSYAACKYYFNAKGEIDENLTFLNTSNFFGKQELVRIALRKYNIAPQDWVFIGDGINDVGVAREAPVSIGISPVSELAEVVDYAFADFEELMACGELQRRLHWLTEKQTEVPQAADRSPARQAEIRVQAQVGNLRLQHLEKRAYKKFRRELGDEVALQLKNRFRGIEQLLYQGELVLALLQQAGEKTLASSTLQPFCNATEIMVTVVLVLNGWSSEISQLIGAGGSWQALISKVKNDNLKTVLQIYRKNRNLISHSYQMLSMDAAESLVFRTYETIQRLELLVDATAEEEGL